MDAHCHLEAICIKLRSFAASAQNMQSFTRRQDVYLHVHGH